jgi:putative transposase
MPIPRRRLLPGYPLHVLQRGHNRDRCFGSDADHALYLGLLQEFSRRHACAIHAYVLMTNHVHLLMSPPDIPRLSKMMKDVNQIFVQCVNRRSGRCGSAWQGRFKAFVVDSGEYFLTCQRYVELNPVRAGMVKQPVHYPWSSYSTNANGKPSGFLTAHTTYLSLGATSATREAAYRSLFGQAIGPELLARIRSSVNRSLPLGDEAFVREVEREMGSERGLN